MFIRVCSDSCRSETRLPGLLKVFLVVPCVLLWCSCISCFARNYSNWQLCLEVVGLSYLNLFTWKWSTRVTQMHTCTKKARFFFDWNNSEITFVKSFSSVRSSYSPTAMSLPRRENKLHRHIYYRLKFSKALLKKMERGSLTLLVVSMWYLHGCSTLDVYLCFLVGVCQLLQIFRASAKL